MMKKLTAMLLVLCMLLAVVPALGDSAAGYWYVNCFTFFVTQGEAEDVCGDCVERVCFAVVGDGPSTVLRDRLRECFVYERGEVRQSCEGVVI